MKDQATRGRRHAGRHRPNVWCVAHNDIAPLTGRVQDGSSGPSEIGSGPYGGGPVGTAEASRKMEPSRLPLSAYFYRGTRLVVLNSHVSRAWAPSRPPVELKLIPEPRQGMAPDAFVKHPGATCHRVGLGAKLSGGKH